MPPPVTLAYPSPSSHTDLCSACFVEGQHFLDRAGLILLRALEALQSLRSSTVLVVSPYPVVLPGFNVDILSGLSVVSFLTAWCLCSVSMTQVRTILGSPHRMAYPMIPYHREVSYRMLALL